MHSFESLLGPVGALLSSITWAVGVQYYSKLAEKYSPFAISFYRGLLSFTVFGIGSLFVAGAWQGITDRNVAWLAFAMLGSYGFGDAVFLWATRLLGVTLPLAIASIYPIWAALGGWFFNGESLNIPQQCGLAVTVLATVLVIFADRRDQPNRNPKDFVLGVLLSFLVSVFWSINTVGVNQGGTGISLFAANTIRMGFAAIMTFSLHRILRIPQAFYFSKTELRKGAPIFAFESVGGSLFYMYGITHSSLALGACLSSLSPVIAVPLAWTFRREKVGPLKGIGIVAVVIGIILLVTGKSL